MDTQYLLTLGYRLVLLLVILAAGWGVGRLVGWLLSRLVTSGGGDSFFRHTSLGRALMKSGYTAATFVDIIARWIIYLTAFLIGVDGLGLPILSNTVGAFLDFLPTIVISMAILIVGLVLSDWIGEFVKRTASPEQRDVLYIGVAADLIKLFLYFVTVTIALANLNVDLTILYIIAQPLAWAVAIFVGVAAGIVVGWTLKDKLKDLLST